MPRILSIATLYPNAHLPRFGTFVARQMEALAGRDGWDVTVINPIGVPPVPMGRYKALAKAAVDGEEGGVAVHRPRFTLIPAVGGPLNPAMIVRAALPIAQRLHAAEPFDLVDAQFFYPDGPAAAQIAEALGLPLSIKARGADISLWGHRAYAQRKMVAAAAQAAGLLSVSEALKADMAAIRLPADKVTVHYTGLDRQLFRPLDRAKSRRQLADDHGINLGKGESLLATVGAFIPRKGQHFVIRALADLPDAHLALVGAGPDRDALQTLAYECDVSHRVHFLGSLDHGALPVVLSAADAMVLPSASEGLANAWVEALACGAPLVITDAGGAKELVRAPSAGRIVARDVAAIASGVREVLAADYPADKVAANASQFSWEANAAALAAFYENIMETHSP
ncbi:glycosyltransferase [Aurantiacibacter gangjinensis]|uniref:Glycoside hydrolase n=1 Tax=Aurantiacibacter gangjinensis TaxID=502682 RepID=A0A0G9MRI2_9SPHN|nr:glycosyltransferase [Aurantiacibacter gangjinensis]APE29063.1 Glycosyl transferase, group 1 family protein [Aurantiacibacter gangjinensis]KLE33154.1 glycoside hydrolase [Aurantiacibacter gangjinensis]